MTQKIVIRLPLGTEEILEEVHLLMENGFSVDAKPDAENKGFFQIAALKTEGPDSQQGGAQ